MPVERTPVTDVLGRIGSTALLAQAGASFRPEGVSGVLGGLAGTTAQIMSVASTTKGVASVASLHSDLIGSIKSASLLAEASASFKPQGVSEVLGSIGSTTLLAQAGVSFKPHGVSEALEGLAGTTRQIMGMASTTAMAEIVGNLTSRQISELLAGITSEPSGDVLGDAHDDNWVTRSGSHELEHVVLALVLLFFVVQLNHALTQVAVRIGSSTVATTVFFTRLIGSLDQSSSLFHGATLVVPMLVALRLARNRRRNRGN